MKMKKNDFNPNKCALASLWPDFVKMDKRSRYELPFVLKMLDSRNGIEVLDAGAGIGATVIPLNRSGRVGQLVINEVDTHFRDLVKKKLRHFGVRGAMTRVDWRSENILKLGAFDAILCLGNSLTYLFDKEDQMKALRHFRQMLKEGGQLLIDERNYEHLFLRGDGENYRWSGNYVYCGKGKVDARPVHIEENLVVMRYRHRKSGLSGDLKLYPFKEGELHALLLESGFSSVRVFGDYKENFAPDKPEFLTYVCSN